MFASRVRRDVTVKGGEAIVTIRKLSGLSLKKAKDAHVAASFASLRNASKDLLQTMKSSDVEAAAAKFAAKKEAEQNADPEARRRARYAAHDREFTLNAGIVRWGGPAVTDPETGRELALNPDNVGDLDEDVAEQLFEEIIDLALGPIGPEAEAAPKDAAPPSTSI